MFGGVALIDKPLDLTSFGVVARIRRAFKEEAAGRVGHTGTLDPLATGLLPICIGEATKFAQRMLDADKGYLATVKLGTSTETGDREGVVTAAGTTVFDTAQIDAVLARFVGAISQVPPKFSALKIDGRPDYELARAGKDVQLAARTVTIHSIKRIAHRMESAELDVEVICSKGTYIRSLAVDIGTALGTVAHLHALRRTRTGGFELDQAKPLDAWLAADPSERRSWLLPVDSLVEDLPRISLDATQTKDIRNGKLVSGVVQANAGGLLRLYSPSNEFLGIGQIDRAAGGILKSQRLMSTA